VANGYDPQQVAAFAAEALSWKRELSATKSELGAVKQALERYESVIGDIEDVEREATQITEEAERRAAQIIEQAEDEAAKILEMARDQVASFEPAELPPAVGQFEPLAPVEPIAPFGPAETVESNERFEPLTPTLEPSSEELPHESDGWFAPQVVESEIPDPIDEIFEPLEERQPTPDLDRRAAAAANLWKRRGVLAPPQ
jgi:chemotaxis regulatin CheY-phosphate phosphatase CheZ